MIRKALPLVAALVLALLVIGPGRQYLPSGLRLQSGGSLVSSGEGSDMDAAHGRPTGIGLAPAPVTNPSATAARLGVVAQPLEKAERGYALTTTVVAPDGKAVEDANVKFYDLVDLFGTREMFIGAATTDGRGVATIAYLPAQPGSHQLVVRFGGQGKATAGEGRMTLNATVSAPQQVTERNGFLTFSDRVPYAAGVIVLAVWGLIAFAFIATARGVIAGARGRRGKEENA